MSVMKNVCIESFERGIVRHCSPTIAGLKPASMFTYHGCGCGKGASGGDASCANRYSLGEAIVMCNAKLAPNGTVVTSLGNTTNGGTLIFVYRPDLLNAVLHESQVNEYLDAAGYDLSNVDFALGSLRERLAHLGSKRFPHEIGLFLGYPFDDVMGFIEDGITHAECTGCWCAFSDAEEARRCFCRYNMCTNMCMRMFESGVSIAQLPIMGHACVPVRAA